MNLVVLQVSTWTGRKGEEEKKYEPTRADNNTNTQPPFNKHMDCVDPLAIIKEKKNKT